MWYMVLYTVRKKIHRKMEKVLVINGTLSIKITDISFDPKTQHNGKFHHIINRVH